MASPRAHHLLSLKDMHRQKQEAHYINFGNDSPAKQMLKATRATEVEHIMCKCQGRRTSSSLVDLRRMKDLKYTPQFFRI